MMTEVLLVNPVPAALHHYERQLAETLDAIGIAHAASSDSRPVEGLGGAKGKILMLKNALRNVRSARQDDDSRLLLWPSLGLLDARLYRSRRAQHMVVLHDPVPIRHQYGHGPLAERWSRRASATSPIIVVHSRYAAQVARERLPRHQIELTLLPVLRKSVDQAHPGHAASLDRGTVLVAGQYKPERDLDLLRRLGPRLREDGWGTRIVGRGWPDVPGWQVDSRFVSEGELDEELRRASILLLPYRNYFQSAVATRALELGTLTMGPRSSFLEDLYGDPNSPLIVAADADPAAYRAALAEATSGRISVASTYQDYAGRVEASWRRLLT